MKCVLPNCGLDANYLFSGMSLCEEHLMQFQRNMTIPEPLTPVLNQTSIPKELEEHIHPNPDTPFYPIRTNNKPNLPISPAKKKASQYLADYKKWKGKKDGKGGHHLADGTWGWNYINQFPPDIVSLVLSEPVVVGDYIYETNETGTTITKRKAKQ